MSVAACLLPVSVAMAVFAPDVLGRLTRSGVAPRWGVAAWLAVIAAVVGSWVASALFLAVDVVAGWREPGRVIASCIAALGKVAVGGSGLLAQAELGMVALAAVASLAALGWRCARSVWRARAHTHEHARHARLVGRPAPGLDSAGLDSTVVVLDAPVRAAYCVAGRPDAIVVTSATLAALEPEQTQAVLAHERAHLDGRHHHLIALTRALAAALPAVRLFTQGALEVARLVEMCADDTAVRAHGRRALLGALLALTAPTPAPTSASTPTSTPTSATTSARTTELATAMTGATMSAGVAQAALGAAGVDVLARAERLATPAPAGVRRRTQTLLGVTTLLAIAGPILTIALATSSIGLVVCGGMAG
jgi:Zn-dependent protease with chaperone function